MDQDLHIHVVRDGKTAIDGSGRRAPVLVQLQTAYAGFDLLDDTRGPACVALAEKAEVHRESIGRLEHALDVPRPRRAGRRCRPGRGSCPSSHHGRHTGIERLFDLLRTNVMDVRIDPTGGDDLAFSCDDLCARPNYDIHMRLHIGIAGLADRGNQPILYCDVGLHDAPMVKYQAVRDDGVDGPLAARSLRLPHTIANDFSAAEFDFLPVSREILLHLDEQIGICEANFVSNGRTKHLRVSRAAKCVRHPGLPYLLLADAASPTGGKGPMTAPEKP